MVRLSLSILVLAHAFKSLKDNVNDALYDAESASDDYLDGIGSEIMKSQSGVASILSTKCFELSEPNFGKIRCTDDGKTQLNGHM